jgi:hypothetical protein
VSRDRDLERRLRELRAPDEPNAEQRSWEVVRAAYEGREPLPTPPRARRLALALAAGVGALAIGLSPAGAKVGELVSDVFSPDAGVPNAKPQLRPLPAAGELLIDSGQGPWIVREDGSKRLLGDYGEATWSPHGLYVTAADGRTLVTVDPAGQTRWTVPAAAAVADPRWSPGDLSVGFWIAYRSGDDLRIVDGTGQRDQLIARDVAPVPAAWRPIGFSKLAPHGSGGVHVLTYVDSDKRIHTVDVDSGKAVESIPADLEELGTPSAGGAGKRAVSPDRSQMATVEAHKGGDRLVVSGDGGASRVLFSARGRLTGPTWSPDGRWLLVGWPEADQWLFISVDRPNRVVAFDQISEQFDPGGAGTASFPSIAGWVLPQR